MHNYALLLFLSFLTTFLPAQFVRLDLASVATIEGYINNKKVDEKMVGLSVGIIRNGEVAYLKGFGYQDSLKNIPATENTIYRLASVSKTITGLMSMRLIEKGLLDLNADIRTYVPEYPVKPQGTITSEELLSNESGIIHYSGSGSCQEPYNFIFRDSYIASHPSTYDPIAALGIFKDQKICFTPGAEYQYTTWGFCLMGAVLQRAGGKDFEDLLYDEVVCPLDLPSLQIEYQSKRPYPNEAAGYEISNGTVTLADSNATDFKDISYKVPGGGMISTVVDLTLLMKGVVNREFIADSTVKLFGTRHTPASGIPSYYGYGTSSNFRNGDTLFWHSGSQSSTATLIYYSPENKNGVVVMCNTRGVSLFPLVRLIYDFLPSTTLTGPAFVDSAAQPACNTVGIESAAKPSFDIYPNPGSDRFTLILNEDMKGRDIAVVSATGQVLFADKLNSGLYQELDLNLPRGFYRVLISDRRGVVTSHKLLIEK